MSQQDREISIEAFDKIADFAERQGVNQTAWAKAAWPGYKGNPQARISELKRISDLVRREGFTQEEASKLVKRKCTVKKVEALSKGLEKIVGKDVARKEYVKFMDDAKTVDEALHWALAAVDDRTKEHFLNIIKPIVKAQNLKD